MLLYFKQLICSHEWRIWWSRTNSHSRITKKSCVKCEKVEKTIDTFGV